MNRNTFARTHQKVQKLRQKPATNRIVVPVIPKDPPVLVKPPVKKHQKRNILPGSTSFWGRARQITYEPNQRQRRKLKAQNR